MLRTFARLEGYKNSTPLELNACPFRKLFGKYGYVTSIEVSRGVLKAAFVAATAGSGRVEETLSIVVDHW